jgi:hypothetical protein
VRVEVQMIDRILNLRKIVIKNGYKPEYLAMNELDLRRLKDNSITEHLKPVIDSWRELIGSKIYGMTILFNPSLDSLQIVYNTSEENERSTR